MVAPFIEKFHGNKSKTDIFSFKTQCIFYKSILNAIQTTNYPTQLNTNDVDNILKLNHKCNLYIKTNRCSNNDYVCKGGHEKDGVQDPAVAREVLRVLHLQEPHRDQELHPEGARHLLRQVLRGEVRDEVYQV